MLGSDYKIFLSIEMFAVSDQVIKESQIPELGRRAMTDYTLLAINHHLQLKMCVTSLARKYSPLTATTTDKQLCEVRNRNSNMLVFKS